MNIFHLEASKGWGGQEIRILKEAEGMRERGHTVIFGVMKGGALIQRAQDSGFIVYSLNFKKWAWLSCLFSLVRIVFFHRIDLINTHSSLDGWIGGIAARLTRRKIVRTRHLSTPIRSGLNSRLVYGKLADFVVTTCASIVPLIAEQSRKPISFLRSIPTGIDPKKIIYEESKAIEFRQKLGFGEKHFLVGTACVMRSWKGINVFLEAANQLRDIPYLRWVVIGGGHAEIHHKKAKELKLDGIVFFMGHLDNPFDAIGSLDCFALLSTANEGVSQAILQAAFLQKPLIATPTGGLQEVCIHEQTGILVPIFDPTAVANGVLRLMNDPDLRRKMGENGKKLVLGEFTLKKTLDQMEDIYNRLGALSRRGSQEIDPPPL